jgi:hypothetical protein|tara:strand:+ start:1018 stop:1242 length:225 start_codon:yes stop_codon:yes gene_type:complete
MKRFYYFLTWLVGFFALLSLDIFMEGLVFEWLKWNGTTKNDWFFQLWWGLVMLWLIFGLFILNLKFNRNKNLNE